MEDFKKGICQIVSADNILGTGFFIGDGKIVTAKHVVEGKQQIEVCFLEIDGTLYTYKCQDKRSDLSLDICILYITEDENIRSYKLSCSTEKVMLDSNFISYGYPGEHGGQMACIKGQVVNAHDGVGISDYNLDLAVTQGIMTSYKGMSGAPIIVNNNVIGIATFQNQNQLQVIEFNKIKNEIENKFDIAKKQLPVINMEHYIIDSDCIINYQLNNDIQTLIISGLSNGIIFVEGCNGSGKTTWVDQSNSENGVVVLGKYYLRRNTDSMLVVYRKNEDVLYDWFCNVATKHGNKRVGFSQINTYKNRYDSIQTIMSVLEDSMREVGKKACYLLMD